ncbi:MAG: glycosyltransferase family 2 protein [Pseudohongiella sp.]|nr:glycosyltransferase family 2 protein [Pseudohongiella sp.]MDP2126476.1 glycosyltransferase family 2 protein [Pseudohongiella sp.]
MTPGMEFTLPLVLVLLPVYNGEKFLREQIDSILNQTHRNLRLVCRDDGSSDASLHILQAYVASHPDRVQLLLDNKGNLGASGSFSELMQRALPDGGGHRVVYVALADQDDIWQPDKLQRCLEAMRLAESASPDIPVLVHSDLRVVDAHGSEIAPSFMRYQGLDPGRTEFSSQLISNTITGCTSLMNPGLLKKALPVPAQAVMHDWWLSLVASAFGRLIYVPEQLVEYRQHGSNTLGAREHKKTSVSLQTFKKIFQLQKNESAQRLFEQAAAQALAFETRFADELSPESLDVIHDVRQLPRLGLWQQRLLFRRLRK